MSSEPIRNTLTLELRQRGVALLWMDDPSAGVNTLKRELAVELERVLGELETLPSLKALVLASGKPDSFAAGIDLEMVQRLGSAAEAQRLAEWVQRVHSRLAALPVPKVAAIHGPILGGGLELALACDGRVASIDPKTRLGFPEVKLGLLPGGGGTQRLPRLIGVRPALDLLLSGAQIQAQRAWEIGLVDAIVPQALLLETAISYALALRLQPPLRRQPAFKDRVWKWLAEDNALGRALLFQQIRRQTLDKTRGHYPAPEHILEVVRSGLEQGPETGYRAEARSFGELAAGAQAAELINIFFAMARLKQETGVDDPQVQPRPVDKVGILGGGGQMGAGITYVTAALAGTQVLLKDKDAAGAGRGIAHIRRLLDQGVQRRRISDQHRTQVLRRLTATIDYDLFAEVDMVIETVGEDAQLKRQLVRDIEAVGRADTIFASHALAIPIGQIAAASAHPHTVIGMRYFPPVENMPLLEVVTTPRTAPWVTATCVELGKRQGKTVIVVNDGPGFYTSRILTPYLNEAGYLLAEGVPVEAIDTALKSFGFPVGPITLLDGIGIDLGETVARNLHQALGERLRPPPALARLLADRRLGCKNKRGFYRYDGRRSGQRVDRSVYGVIGVEPAATVAAREISERCILQMVNEAAHCFEQGVLHSARDGDIGAVFGLGFPPFRGGPFRYIDALGARQMVARLESYARRYGERFTPALVLIELARSGARFYGRQAVTPGAMARA